MRSLSLNACHGACSLQGIMTCYGSYLPRHSSLVADALIICLADAAIAFLAGFVIYASLGNLAATSSGTSVADVGGSAGLGLAFVTYPQVRHSLGHDALLQSVRDQLVP